MLPSSSRRAARGFTLIELLVVIVIIAIIAGFAIPAIAPVLKGSAVTQGGTALADQMSLARQYAITHNCVVEVRFYRFADAEVPGEQAADPLSGQFRGIQFFQRSDSGIWIPVSTFVRLPDRAMMNFSARLSTILGEDKATRYVDRAGVAADAANHVELPRNVKLNYEYAKFHFQTTGGTDLKPNGNPQGDSAGGRWHITVHSLDDLPRTNPPASDKAPPNYICWAIDPVTGVGKVYRPGK